MPCIVRNVQGSGPQYTRSAAMKLEKITFIIGISALLIACSNSPAPVQMQVSGGYIQYNAGYGWQNLIDVESLRGPQGLPGPQGPQGPAGIDAILGGAESSAGAPTATPDPDGQDAAGSPDTETCEHLYQCTTQQSVLVEEYADGSLWRMDSTYECEKCGAVVVYSYKYKQPGTAGSPGSPAPSPGSPHVPESTVPPATPPVSTPTTPPTLPPTQRPSPTPTDPPTPGPTPTFTVPPTQQPTEPPEPTNTPTAPPTPVPTSTVTPTAPPSTPTPPHTPPATTPPPSYAMPPA